MVSFFGGTEQICSLTRIIKITSPFRAKLGWVCWQVSLKNQHFLNLMFLRCEKGQGPLHVQYLLESLSPYWALGWRVDNKNQCELEAHGVQFAVNCSNCSLTQESCVFFQHLQNYDALISQISSSKKNLDSSQFLTKGPTLQMICFKVENSLGLMPAPLNTFEPMS